jgi:hypothetical protein
MFPDFHIWECLLCFYLSRLDRAKLFFLKELCGYFCTVSVRSLRATCYFIPFKVFHFPLFNGLFLLVLKYELRTSQLSSLHWNHSPNTFSALVIFQIGFRVFAQGWPQHAHIPGLSDLTIFPSWLWATIFLLSASHVAEVTGVGHHPWPNRFLFVWSGFRFTVTLGKKYREFLCASHPHHDNHIQYLLWHIIVTQSPQLQ